MQIQFQLFVTGARRALYVGYNPDSEVTKLFVKKIGIHWTTVAKIMKAIDKFQVLYNQYQALPDIIAIAGYAQQGKDTFGAVLEPYGYSRVSFADKLKTDAVEAGILSANFTEEEKKEKRPEIVAMAEAKRAEDPDYYVRHGIGKIVLGKQSHFTDVRHINELFGLEDFALKNNLSLLSV